MCRFDTRFNKKTQQEYIFNLKIFFNLFKLKRKVYDSSTQNMLLLFFTFHPLWQQKILRRLLTIKHIKILFSFYSYNFYHFWHQLGPSKKKHTFFFFLIRIHLNDFNSCLLHHTGKHHTCEYLMQLKKLTCTTRVALIVVKMFKVMFCLACHMIKEDIIYVNISCSL